MSLSIALQRRFRDGRVLLILLLLIALGMGVGVILLTYYLLLRHLEDGNTYMYHSLSWS